MKAVSDFLDPGYLSISAQLHLRHRHRKVGLAPVGLAPIRLGLEFWQTPGSSFVVQENHAGGSLWRSGEAIRIKGAIWKGIREERSAS